MEIEELISRLPNTSEHKWSFLETIGVAHRETIIANLLGFYFDPSEKHGLNGTFIKALLETTPKKLCENVKGHIPSYVSNTSKEGFSWANVIIEDSTDDNKRIDILIETEELVIVIEFKINHELNNPLGSYVSRVNKKYPDKKPYYLVLTPQWKSPVGAAIGNQEFQQIILSEFIQRVKSSVKELDGLGNEISNQQELIYNDFIDTIDNRKIRVKMINEYFEKVQRGENGFSNSYVEMAYEQFGILKDEIEKRVSRLAKQLNQKGTVRFSTLGSSKDKIESVIYCKRGDAQIKVRLNLNGWNIEFWDKKDGGRILVDELALGYKTSLDNLVSTTEDWIKDSLGH